MLNPKVLFLLYKLQWRIVDVKSQPIWEGSSNINEFKNAIKWWLVDYISEDFLAKKEKEKWVFSLFCVTYIIKILSENCLNVINEVQNEQHQQQGLSIANVEEPHVICLSLAANKMSRAELKRNEHVSCHSICLKSVHTKMTKSGRPTTSFIAFIPNLIPRFSYLLCLQYVSKSFEDIR